MKKLYISLFSLAIAFGANAQKSTDVVTNRQVNTDKQANRELNQSSVQRGGGLSCPFVEGFDAGFPATWSQVVTNTGASNTTWYWSATAGNPDGGMDITYDANLDDQLESMTTSVIDLSAIPTPGLYFDWFMSYYWAVDPNENYDVTVAISTNGGTTWTDLWTEADAGVFESFVWQTKIINLSAYASETTVTFRFTYEGNDGAQASLDNINICSLPSNDLEVNTVWHGDIINLYEYEMIPLSQATEVMIGVTTFNGGVATQNNVTYTYDISLAGNSVASGDFDATNTVLSSGSTDTTWFSTGYTPSSIGDYIVTVSVAADEMDVFMENNTGSSNFEITEYEWSHETQSLWDEPNGPYIVPESDPEVLAEVAFGMIYQPVADATLYAIKVSFGNSTSATSSAPLALTAEVHTIGENIQDIVESEIQAIDVVGTGWQTFVFENPISLTEGARYILAVRVSGGGDDIMTINGWDSDDDFATANNGPFGTAGAINWYSGWDYSSAIRAIFDPTVGISENQDLTGIQMFPNPANDVLTVKFNANESNDIRVNVIGMDGKMVFSQSVNAFSGQFTSRISLEGVANGMYSVQVISDNATYTQKVAVVK